MKPYYMGVAYCTPPAAKVAPVKTAYPGVRPWCAKKGMCLSIDPPCTQCAEQRCGAPNTSNQRDPERTALRIVIAVMCVITFATACGVAGYFSA